jgi:hypothetical protein
MPTMFDRNVVLVSRRMLLATFVVSGICASTAGAQTASSAANSKSTAHRCTTSPIDLRDVHASSTS